MGQSKLQDQFRYLESKTGNEKILVRKISNPSTDIEHTVLILHDYFDYHKYYIDLAESIVSEYKNYEVILFDYKGLGRSSGDRGYVSNWNIFISEVQSILKEELRTPKVSIVGAGLGGVIGLDLLLSKEYGAEEKVANAIIINPLLKMKLDYPHWAQGVIRNFPNFLEKARFPIKFNYHRFCTDFHHAQVVNADPLIPHDISFRTMIELLETNNRLKSLSYFIKKPSLILLSEKGHLCNNDFIKIYAKGVDRKYVRMEEINGAYHDLIHDKNKEMVYQLILDFLKKQG